MFLVSCCSIKWYIFNQLAVVYRSETNKKQKTKNEVINVLVASLQECEVGKSKELDRRTIV